jgi:hypothetical protein
MPSAMSSGRDSRIARRYGSLLAVGDMHAAPGQPGNVGTAVTHVVHHAAVRRIREPPIGIARLL